MEKTTKDIEIRNYHALNALQRKANTFKHKGEKRKQTKNWRVEYGDEY